MEVVAEECARGLAALGHEVSLFAPDGSSCPGVTVVPFGKEKETQEGDAYQKALPYLAKMECIIDHSWHKFAYLGKRDGPIKCPVLGVCHAPINTMFGSPPPVPKPCVVCISEDQKNHYEALFGNVRGRVCYNGIDLQRYRPVECKRSNRFLFLARFSSVKGADIAIKACKEAKVGLDLVGDTQLTGEPAFLESLRPDCDGAQIRLVGPCNRGEAVWWYSQAHCLLHPNERFREPFGLAPVEAMACGCPVVSWDYGAMRETVGDPKICIGTGGYLADNYEQFVNLVRLMAIPSGIDEDDRKDAQHRASRFSLENMVKRYEELCKEAVESGGW